jgi:hypothetical protein
MPDSYLPPRCAECGHADGEHNYGRRTLAGALMGGHRWPGVCLVSLCDCRRFVPNPEDEVRDAA